ncbi:hypothetical protein [Pseudoalteromonas sp. Angola-7]|uniref:hypothetical protein n=1 Tax=Pseudoalteromonas sp. Angola-7 TaxID=3025336 RepID=UPI002359494A|nr:hypothetical protein [Pseudoalteromonas sp. Angola-7]MDC9529635.1 hypothetical protein [Pseudoalteromonas sp. Angola-7]
MALLLNASNQGSYKNLTTTPIFNVDEELAHFRSATSHGLNVITTVKALLLNANKLRVYNIL